MIAAIKPISIGVIQELQRISPVRGDSLFLDRELARIVNDNVLLMAAQ
jgi:hypothetical protein